METTGDVRASSFLFQRISVVVQRFNSVSPGQKCLKNNNNKTTLQWRHTMFAARTLETIGR